MVLENLVNKQGRLAEIYPGFVRETIQHADEITRDRKTDEELRRKWFWTADFAMYSVEDKETVLYLARNETNVVFNNIEESTKQLIRDGNYRVEKQDIANVVNADTSLKIKLSELDLKTDGDYAYFDINTSAPKLNDAQRVFAERVYGQREDFNESMKMLKNAGINSTRVYVLSQKYVKDNVKEGESIGRACWLYDFGDSSNFDADVRYVGSPNDRLRGVLKVGEADANEKLVNLPEQKMHELLEKYVAPVSLGNAKEEIQKLYK